MIYEVVGELPEAALPDLCRLWTRNLALRASATEHFRWLYQDAPEAGKVFLLRARSPDGSTQVVGANGVTTRRFQLAPGVFGRAGVSGDLAVDLEHRSLLPALRLARSVRELIVDDFDLGYGFPNAKAKGVMVRAGFKVLGHATRHVRVLRHARYLPDVVQRLHASPRLASLARLAHLTRRWQTNRLLGPLVDIARLAGTAPRFARARSHYRLAWCDDFDARFDTLWIRARDEYEVIGERTAALLRWRYPDCEIAAMVRGPDPAILAYALVEHDPATGAAHLRDVFGHKPELGALIDLLVPALYRRGAITVSVSFLGAPDLLEQLAARGFEQRPDQRTIVVQVGVGREALRARLEDARAWHLFDLDEDT